MRTREAITEHLISDWTRTVNESISEALAAGPSSTAGEKLTAFFSSPAHRIAENAHLRAGMKLTLEPTSDNGAAFAHWVEVVSDIIDTVITVGELSDTPPPPADSPGTFALAPSEPPTY